MERNILQTVGLALMLLALCPGPPILGQTTNSDGITSPTSSTDGPTETSTPSGETKTSTTISTTGTPPITSSTESSATATTSEGTTKSHVTEIFTTPTEGSRETSTPSVENENSTAISPSGTPTITSSTESSATATTPEGTTNSYGTKPPTPSTEGSRETSTPSGETKRSTTGTPPITSSTESSATATTPEGTTKSHATEIFTTSIEGSGGNSTSSGENENSTAISPSGTPPITSPTESSATATTFEGTTKSHATEIFTTSTEGSGGNSTSSGENENSTATSPPGSQVTKQETTTPSPTTTSTSSKTTTPKPPIEQMFTITYHITMNFTKDLMNPSSEAYQNLTGTIGKMYEEVYNCSKCPTHGQYVGFTVNSFRNGSVLANTTLHFKESAKVSKDELHKALTNASEKWQGLNLTKIEVTSDATEPSTSPPSATTSSPTSTPTTTTSTTPPSLMYYSLSYHIERVFSDDLLNPSSSAYSSLSMTIGKMYNAVYNCSVCPAAGSYSGYTVNSFRPGSVVADTTLWFKEGKPISSEELHTALSQATPEQLQYLKLSNIEVRKLESDTPNRPETVPGWGIALLVLVCILLLLALIAFLILIIYWCRRNHRGELDLLSNQDSYHIMSEYPKYNTHGRYVAPGSKPNPYSETLPRNGNAPFSYTNPTMANDEL